ncbi:MAG: PIN domain-containing protein [Gammaproteobacteria bacterium]|nr:PIN domain-containing protein [Gammaproteobacteria bacterium]
MILVDANLLIYAVNASDSHHDAAREWLDERLSLSETVGFPWLVILAFLRIGTHPNLFPIPLTPEAAVEKMSRWLEQPVAQIIDPNVDHWTRVGELMVRSQCRANLVQDAHLAALAMEFGATLCTTDADFSRFAGLKWINPLIS